MTLHYFTLVSTIVWNYSEAAHKIETIQVNGPLEAEKCIDMLLSINQTLYPTELNHTDHDLTCLTVNFIRVGMESSTFTILRTKMHFYFILIEQ